MMYYYPKVDIGHFLEHFPPTHFITKIVHGKNTDNFYVDGMIVDLIHHKIYSENYMLILTIDTITSESMPLTIEVSII